MVQTYVIVTGKDLLIPRVTDNEIFVYGKLTATIFLKNECIDTIYQVSPMEVKVETISFQGSKFVIVYKDAHTVVLDGNIERMNFINRNGKVIKSVDVKECDE